MSKYNPCEHLDPQSVEYFKLSILDSLGSLCEDLLEVSGERKRIEEQRAPILPRLNRYLMRIVFVNCDHEIA